MATIGLIGGTNADFAFGWQDDLVVETQWGNVAIARGAAAGADVYFVRRHGPHHELLSSQVSHRANISALKQMGVEAIIATTVCGVVDPDMPLARPIVFDDLFFPDNRLPDGSACSYFETPGEAGRGHYIFGSSFSPSLRCALAEAAGGASIECADSGTYAYMLGPRFNSRSEIAWLRSVGAMAVSQTAGPEAVLAGELEIPYALLGFGVDYANGVQSEPTPVDVLDANIAASKGVFGAIVAGAIGRLAEPTFDTGFVYRFK